jgi:hypothetical protein
MTLPGHLVNFSVFSFFKAAMYSLTASFAAATFGDANLGTIMGAVYLFMGLTNLLTYPLAVVSISTGTYWWVNFGLALSSVPLFALAPLRFLKLKDANRGAMVDMNAGPTDYLDIKARCSNPGCSGMAVRKCSGCRHLWYCHQSCQYAHWKAHKPDCKKWSAELGDGRGED